MTLSDMELVRKYARENSEEAFATLVSRHINLVYSVAMRQTRDSGLAEEVTQTVFIILARKAGSLNPKTLVSGWLCRAARFASANAVTAERRRQHREQEAFMHSDSEDQDSDAAAAWTQIAPLLDGAMGQLGEKDHDALVLRFLEGRSFKEVSSALGVSEAGAKMRVNRALEKMRRSFAKRGLTLSAGLLVGALSANSVQAAPIGLATSVTVAAVHGVSVTTSTLTLIKTTLKIMAWTKVKTVAVTSGIVLLAIGTSSVAVCSLYAQAPATGEVSKTPTPASAGYATADAGFRSFIAALATGDKEKVMAACTPEQAKRFAKKFEGKSDSDISADMIAWAGRMTDFKVTEKENISAEEVRLHVEVPPYPGHPNVANDLQVMRKTGRDWKYAGKWGVDIIEK